MPWESAAETSMMLLKKGKRLGRETRHLLPGTGHPMYTAATGVRQAPPTNKAVVVNMGVNQVLLESLKSYPPSAAEIQSTEDLPALSANPPEGNQANPRRDTWIQTFHFQARDWATSQPTFSMADLLKTHMAVLARMDDSRACSSVRAEGRL